MSGSPPPIELGEEQDSMSHSPTEIEPASPHNDDNQRGRRKTIFSRRGDDRW